MRQLLVCAAVWLLFPAADAGAAPAPADAANILMRVQRAYRGRGLEAVFTQTYTDAITGDRPTETGTLKASGDGRVRFDYDAPDKKTFVYDGNSAYFYEPEAAQVTILEHFADAPAARTMALLWGEGSFTTAFRSALCNEQCLVTSAAGRSLTLIPVTPMPGVERVDLVVDGKSFEVQQTRVTDALGNRTRYALTGRKLGPPLAAGLFDFVVPQGVSVLRTRP